MFGLVPNNVRYFMWKWFFSCNKLHQGKKTLQIKLWNEGTFFSLLWRSIIEVWCWWNPNFFGQASAILSPASPWVIKYTISHITTLATHIYLVRQNHIVSYKVKFPMTDYILEIKWRSPSVVVLMIFEQNK